MVVEGWWSIQKIDSPFFYGCSIPYLLYNMSDTERDMVELVEKVMKVVRESDTGIVLLRDEEVVRWVCGTLYFLPEHERTNKKTEDNAKSKKLEDQWGQSLQKRIRSDRNSGGQWTTLVGEQIGRELMILSGESVSKPVCINGFAPDLETSKVVVEVKTQTYHTSGTAGEKILGVPVKYSDVPELYGKPVQILCIAGAEKVSRESYGILPGNNRRFTPSKQRQLDFWRGEGFEYVGATDILRRLV